MRKCNVSEYKKKRNVDGWKFCIFKDTHIIIMYNMQGCSVWTINKGHTRCSSSEGSYLRGHCSCLVDDKNRVYIIMWNYYLLYEKRQNNALSLLVFLGLSNREQSLGLINDKMLKLCAKTWAPITSWQNIFDVKCHICRVSIWTLHVLMKILRAGYEMTRFLRAV